jgi:hypothetical protein
MKDMSDDFAVEVKGMPCHEVYICWTSGEAMASGCGRA